MTNAQSCKMAGTNTWQIVIEADLVPDPTLYTLADIRFYNPNVTLLDTAGNQCDEIDLNGAADACVSVFTT